MKKMISILVVTVMLAAAFGVSVLAADSVNVTVTISDGNGNIAVCLENMIVYDTDGDGKFTVNDVLATADPEGFEAETTEWGLSIKKLCGVENGGSYGYMINDQMAMSLTDEVKFGDYVAAYVFQDPQGLSDSYAFFADKKTAAILEGDTFEMKLCRNAFDENWNVVVEPVNGADIYIGGEKTDLKTDENGRVTISYADLEKFADFEEWTHAAEDDEQTEKEYRATVNIFAKAEGMTLDCAVASFELVRIEGKEAPLTDTETTDAPETEAPTEVKRSPQTGDATVVVLALLAASGAAIVIAKRRED